MKLVQEVSFSANNVPNGGYILEFQGPSNRWFKFEFAVDNGGLRSVENISVGREKINHAKLNAGNEPEIEFVLDGWNGKFEIALDENICYHDNDEYQVKIYKQTAEEANQ